MTGAKPSQLPLILLTIGVLSVSVSGLIAHRALAESTPLMLAAWRMGAAAIFFLVLQGFQRRSSTELVVLKLSERARLALAGLVLALHFVVWFTSLDMTTVSVATLLVCTTPVWAAIGQIGLGKRAAKLDFWVSFMLALLGIALVVHPGGQISTRAITGDLYGLAGGALFAVYLLAIDGLQHLPSSRIVASTYAVAAIILWVAAFTIGHPTLHYSLPVWEAIALLTIVPQIIGHTLINDALKYFQAHVVAFSILAEPVIAASLAVVLLHEVVTLVMLLGGLMVLSSLGFVLARTSRKPTAEAVSEGL